MKTTILYTLTNLISKVKLLLLTSKVLLGTKIPGLPLVKEMKI
jgi:hypothetical protein